MKLPTTSPSTFSLSPAPALPIFSAGNAISNWQAIRVRSAIFKRQPSWMRIYVLKRWHGCGKPKLPLLREEVTGRLPLLRTQHESQQSTQALRLSLVDFSQRNNLRTRTKFLIIPIGHILFHVVVLQEGQPHVDFHGHVLGQPGFFVDPSLFDHYA